MQTKHFKLTILETSFFECMCLFTIIPLKLSQRFVFGNRVFYLDSKALKNILKHFDFLKIKSNNDKKSPQISNIRQFVKCWFILSVLCLVSN